ncbi:MAG: 50S ribosomal protein L13 [Thermoplasmata archaeon]|nr:50S ribosomal protein L13 [Thermoplasmata archaeon]
MAATVIDASGLILGRLSANVAKRLLNGEEIVIVNAEKAIITGGKEDIIAHFRHRRDVGGDRKGPHYPRTPHMMLKRSVRGMLPFYKPRGRAAYKRLLVHISVPKEFKGKKFESIEGASELSTQRYMALGEVSKVLGYEVRE